MTEDRKTIRNMCEEFDVTPRTLRFYEAKELISPKARWPKTPVRQTLASTP